MNYIPVANYMLMHVTCKKVFPIDAEFYLSHRIDDIRKLYNRF